MISARSLVDGVGECCKFYWQHFSKKTKSNVCACSAQCVVTVTVEPIRSTVIGNLGPGGRCYRNRESFF
jgi:hypothetical protein